MDKKRVFKFTVFKLIEIALIIIIPWSIGLGIHTFLPESITSQLPTNPWCCGTLSMFMCAGALIILCIVITLTWELIKLNWKWAKGKDNNQH